MTEQESKRAAVTQEELDAIAEEAARLMEARPQMQPYDAIIKACETVAARFRQVEA